MTYQTYIQRATADGYSLRYSWIRIRMPNSIRGLLYGALLIGTFVGCDQTHRAMPESSYYMIVYCSAILSMCVFAIIALIDRPRKLGFVEFTEDEIRFVRAGNKVDRTFTIDQINYIAGPRLSEVERNAGDSARDITSRQLTIVMRGGERFRFECLSAAFFTARHEPLGVTLEMLAERVALRCGINRRESDF